MVCPGKDRTQVCSELLSAEETLGKLDPVKGWTTGASTSRGDSAAVTRCRRRDGLNESERLRWRTTAAASTVLATTRCSTTATSRATTTTATLRSTVAAALRNA